MQLHESVITRFYTGLQQRDAAAMAACYHPDVEFSDPAFPSLKGERAIGMWRMLCERATDLEVTFGAVHADDQRGRAHWEARYTFSRTGRRVHNVIDASFQFREGKILRHVDSFDLWRWSRMALGLKGQLLGWLPPVQASMRRQFAHVLDAWLAGR